jgi:hypothetical protein
MNPVMRSLLARLADPAVPRTLEKMAAVADKQRRVIDGLLRVVAKLEKRVAALEAIRSPPIARTERQAPRTRRTRARS